MSGKPVGSLPDLVWPNERVDLRREAEAELEVNLQAYRVLPERGAAVAMLARIETPSWKADDVIAVLQAEHPRIADRLGEDEAGET